MSQIYLLYPATCCTTPMQRAKRRETTCKAHVSPTSLTSSHWCERLSSLLTRQQATIQNRRRPRLRARAAMSSLSPVCLSRTGTFFPKEPEPALKSSRPDCSAPARTSPRTIWTSNRPCKSVSSSPWTSVFRCSYQSQRKLKQQRKKQQK